MTWCRPPHALRSLDRRPSRSPSVTTTLGGFVLFRHNEMIEADTYHTGDSHPEVARKVRRLGPATGHPLESFTEPPLSTLLYAEGKRIIRKYPLRYLQLSAMRVLWSGTTRIGLRFLRSAELPRLPARVGAGLPAYGWRFGVRRVANQELTPAADRLRA